MAKVYASVKDGKVTEYPITEVNIRNRKETIDKYTECIIDEKPTPVPFYFIKETAELYKGKVYVSFKLVAFNLDNLINYAHLTLMRKNQSWRKNQTIDFKDVDSVLMERIKKVAESEVQEKLDDFAKKRGFDNINTLCTYKNSTIEAWVINAERGITIRDQSWVALYEYFSLMEGGVNPFPATGADIFKVLPEMTW